MVCGRGLAPEPCGLLTSAGNASAQSSAGLAIATAVAFGAHGVISAVKKDKDAEEKKED